MIDIEFEAAPVAKLRQVVAAEVQAYRWVNGEPKEDDVRHLAIRVRVQMEPGIAEDAIETEIRQAISQGSK
jgi:hypothetical protein